MRCFGTMLAGSIVAPQLQGPGFDPEIMLLTHMFSHVQVIWRLYSEVIKCGFYMGSPVGPQP